MKTYNTPALVEYGQVGALTGIFGSSMAEDQSFGPNGRQLEGAAGTGTGSINQCATVGNVNCL